MRFYTSGNENNPVILLIPGTCCHWSIFDEVTPLLNRNFHTITVSFDGFDETENTIYPTMQRETEKIEQYILQHYDGHICACYGSSLGGSYTAYLVQRGNIHIDHAIIGSSDMDADGKLPAALKASVITPVLYDLASRGHVPSWLTRAVAKRKKEDAEMGKQMQRFVDLFTNSPIKGKLKRESIWNQYYYDLVTPIRHHIQVKGTVIHVFYATGMGKKYEKRYLTYFANPDIRRQNLNHETFFFCYPHEWTKEVEDCCGITKKLS